MKKGLAISLLAVLVFNTVGFVALFQIVRYNWRQTVRCELAENFAQKEKEIFCFSKNDDNAFKHEFSIKGKYYDVISRQIKGDSVILMCFSDEKETQLVAHFHNELQQKQEENSDFQGKTHFLFGHLLKHFCFDNTLWVVQCPPSVSHNLSRFFIEKNTFIPSVYLSNDTPPPEV